VTTEVTTSARRPYVHRSSHADRPFDSVERYCRKAVDVRTVQHIAHYSQGVLDLGVDVLDQDPVVTGPPRRLSVERQRRDLETLGRQFHYSMRSIGDSLAILRSGPLIRAVFDVGHGALFYFIIRPAEYLVGMTLNGDAVTDADQVMAKTARSIRRSLHLGDLDHGGFNKLADKKDEGAGGPKPDPTLVVAGSAAAGEADENFITVSKMILDPRDLHYVARHTRGRCVAADVLAHASLDQFFRPISRDRRRAAYQDIGRDFQALSSTLDNALRGVLQGRLERTVLDVEEGAIYFRRTGPQQYIMGVTLDQPQVFAAQLRFDKLTDQLVRPG
jgi:hypothetical protein